MTAGAGDPRRGWNWGDPGGAFWPGTVLGVETVVQGCTKEGAGFDFDDRSWRGWELRPLGGRRSRRREAEGSARPSSETRAAGAGASTRLALGAGLRGLGARVAPGRCDRLPRRPALLESPGRVDRVGSGRGDAEAKRCAGTERGERVGIARRPGVGFSTKRMLEIVTRREG